MSEDNFWRPPYDPGMGTEFPTQFQLYGNNWGQGADYLNLEDTPESWDRVADMNDLYDDFFKRTGTYLEDWIPGLIPEVEAPEFDGDTYRSDFADIYRNNPAYTYVQEAVASGVPVETAIDAALEKGAEMGWAIPTAMSDGTQSDFNQPGTRTRVTDAGEEETAPAFDERTFTQNAVKFIEEINRENREFDEREQMIRQYEDYVRPRTAMDFLAPDERERIMAEPNYRSTSPSQLNTRSTMRRTGQPGVFRQDFSIRPQRSDQNVAAQRASSGQQSTVEGQAKLNSVLNNIMDKQREMTINRYASQRMPSAQQYRNSQLADAYTQMLYGGAA